ncbi:hypothetical protein ASZ78_002070 [Callipepla squamata]|uniref:Transmembrane protein n=1 Tax=Callipepla squamata TaxID=9009 RepID=A0A226NA54_CALSU|nr:hypothetical protein ASZ78_002070 [Callipepla squamata]
MRNSGSIRKDALDHSCQQRLPATGVPVTWQRFDHVRSMFDEYVRNSTLQNWKFWIVSFPIDLLDMRGKVRSSVDRKAALQYLHAALHGAVCRRLMTFLYFPGFFFLTVVLSSLRQLSISTSILSDPSRLPEQATEAVSKTNETAGET